jgi:hypothetical protein
MREKLLIELANSMCGSVEMKCKIASTCLVSIGIALWTAGCSMPAPTYAGPGCLINIYNLPNLQGAVLPIRQDTERLAAPWHDTASSAKVIFGTWRLYTDPDFNGFMGDYRAPAAVPFLVPAHQLGSLKCLRPEPAPPPQYY